MESIRIDTEHYQRALTPFLGELIKNFRPSALGVIHVSRRRDRSLWAMDGQHRLVACRDKGVESIDAKVYHDLSIPEEARYFCELNYANQVTPLAIFKARLTALDPRTVAIEKILDKEGVGVATGRFFAVRAAEWVAAGCGGVSTDGLESLRWALQVCTRSWPRVVTGTSKIDGTILRSIAMLKCREDWLDAHALAAKLGQWSPGAILAQARTMTSGSLANRVAWVLVDRWNYRRKANTIRQWDIRVSRHPVTPQNESGEDVEDEVVAAPRH